MHFSEEAPTMEELDNSADTKINPEAIRGIWCLANERQNIDFKQWEEIQKKNLLYSKINFPPLKNVSNLYPKFYQNINLESALPYLVALQEGWPTSTM